MSSLTLITETTDKPDMCLSQKFRYTWHKANGTIESHIVVAEAGSPPYFDHPVEGQFFNVYVRVALRLDNKGEDPTLFYARREEWKNTRFYGTIKPTLDEVRNIMRQRMNEFLEYVADSENYNPK